MDRNVETRRSIREPRPLFCRHKGPSSGEWLLVVPFIFRYGVDFFSGVHFQREATVTKSLHKIIQSFSRLRIRVGETLLPQDPGYLEAFLEKESARGGLSVRRNEWPCRR